jgi:hypothetical protein
MKLRAFNLQPGCVLDDADVPCDAVVVSIERDADSETVDVGWMGHGEDLPEEYQGMVFHQTWDFCDKVKIVGICVNPDTWDDNDFGRN